MLLSNISSLIDIRVDVSPQLYKALSNEIRYIIKHCYREMRH